MTWLQSHWTEVLEVATAVYVLLGAVNGLLPYNGEARKRLSYLLDLLSPLARKDAAGTLKLPLTASKPMPKE